MNKLLLHVLLSASFALGSTAAFAGERAYVRSNGAGAACTQAAPCATFAAALTVAAVEGEVICLDSGFFGSFTINNSVTINCENHIGQAGATLNTINTPAGSTVVLNGIDIDERNFGGTALTFSGQGTLVIRNSSIRRATNAINFTPSGNARLEITNTNLEINDNLALLVQPSGGATTKVDIDGLRATGNVGGIATVAAAGRVIELEMRNSLVAQNSNYGVVGSTTGGVSVVFIEKSSVSNNASIGAYASGGNSFVLVSDSVIARNNLGWGFAGGGNLLSFGNNVFNNAGGGAPSGLIGLQ